MVFGFLKKNKSLDDMSSSDINKLSSKEFANIFHDEYEKCFSAPQSEIPLIYNKLSHFTMAWMKKAIDDANCMYAICIIGNEEWKVEQLEVLFNQAELASTEEPSLKAWFKAMAMQSIEARKLM